MEHQVIIVGGGIAGSAAALRAAQYHIRTAWVLGDRSTAKSSRGRYVRNIDNMIGIHEGVLKDAMIQAVEPHGAACARALRDGHFHIGTQAIIDDTMERLRSDYAGTVEMIGTLATSAQQEGDGFVVETSGGELRGPYIVLATGVADRQPRIKKTLPSGRSLDDIHWVYPFANRELFLYCIRCEGHLTREVPAAVIGHSAAAAEVALILHERYGTPVTILTNGEKPEFPDRTGRLLAAYGIGTREERLVEILGDPSGKELQGLHLESGPDVNVRFAFVSLGLHRVFNDLAIAIGCELEPGPPREEAHVVVSEHAETSVRGCFAVGDMATHAHGPIRKQIYTAQEYAVRAVDRIDRRLRAARREDLVGP